MIKFKICMLGAFAVGKTSLVERYVNSIFNEKYNTTLGVKIDKKILQIDQDTIDLILWDLAGEDEFMKVRSSYLRGTSAALLVADGTRAETLDVAFELNERLLNEVGDIPVVLLINKSDIKNSWNIDQPRLNEMIAAGWQIVETSAKDNQNVDEVFHKLATRLLSNA